MRPGEQPRIANPVKLNANETYFAPSPLALEAMPAAAVDMTAPVKSTVSRARRMHA
jgi:hypothetical protein